MASNFINIIEASEIIGGSEQTLRRWVREGKVTLVPKKRGGGQGNPKLYSRGDIRKIANERNKRLRIKGGK